MKYRILLLLTLFAFALHMAGQGKRPSHEATTPLLQYASTLLDSTLAHYATAERGLFNEHYPKDVHAKATYLAGEDTLSRDKVAYLWPTSGLFSAVNALLRASGQTRYQTLLEQTILPGLTKYYDTTRTPPGYQSYPVAAGHSDRFYDDNIWLGIDYVESFALTGESEYLNAARSVWAFLESGRDDKLGDGIYWCEQKKRSKNTCSNAPAAVLALLLYQATHHAPYLKAGREIYEWTRKNLQDPTDGLYWDHITLQRKISKTKYAYNSGQMMQAAALLYKATGHRQYLHQAQQLARACSDHFFEKRDTPQGRVRVLKNGMVWFTAIMLRGFEALYKADSDRQYLDDFTHSLRALWQQHADPHGLFADDWLDPTTPPKAKAHKWLLTQAALVEMYARLASLPDGPGAPPAHEPMRLPR